MADISKIVLPDGSEYNFKDTVARAATGTGVTGAKGDAEETYRTGNVNITKANIGLGNVDNTADEDKVVAEAAIVNGHTVESDVPENAVFTDHMYTAATAAPGNVASTSSVGVSENYARQDHTHGIDLATGDANGQVKIAGTNVSVKGLGSAAYTESTDYAAASHGTHVTYGSVVASVGTTANSGSASTVSRSDHVHDIALATGDANGQVKIAGQNVSVYGLGSAAYTDSSDYSASDHTHDVLTQNEANTGTGTTGKFITAKVLNDTIDNKAPYLSVLNADKVGNRTIYVGTTAASSMTSTLSDGDIYIQIIS